MSTTLIPSGRGAVSFAGIAEDQLRLMLLAARLYHVHGIRQREVAERLGVSQTRVSRLLSQAEERGIVRTVVAAPEGLHSEVEEQLESAFGLLEVHVVQAGSPGEQLSRTLGRAAAHHFADAVITADAVGFTSWSTAFQEMAVSLRAHARPSVGHVVEMLGDLGSPVLQHSAAGATQAIARALGAAPVFLRTPGVTRTPELRDAALADPHVRSALSLLDDLDIAFVGVGPAEVHSRLEPGDAYFTTEQLAEARALGAVGQLNQRFLTSDGAFLPTPLDDLVVGSTLDQIGRAGRRVIVAGGPEKVFPISAALRGQWADVLFTDTETASALLASV